MKEFAVSYSLVLTEPIDEGKKGWGEYVLYKGLPKDYLVYLFYYPGRSTDNTLTGQLQDLGYSAGKNLFVNVGGINDPEYSKIATKFGIYRTPVILMTAGSELALLENDDGYSTLYARIDKEDLLKDTDKIMKIIDIMFNLFIKGEISRAITEAKRYQRDSILSRIKSITIKALKVIDKHLDERDIVVSFAGLKLELKRTG